MGRMLLLLTVDPHVWFASLSFDLINWFPCGKRAQNYFNQ